MFFADPTRAILSCGEILVGTFKTEPIFEKRTHDMGHLYFYVFSIVMSWIMVRIYKAISYQHRQTHFSNGVNCYNNQINLFIAIVAESYSKAKSHYKASLPED